MVRLSKTEKMVLRSFHVRIVHIKSEGWRKKKAMMSIDVYPPRHGLMLASMEMCVLWETDVLPMLGISWCCTKRVLQK